MRALLIASIAVACGTTEVPPKSVPAKPVASVAPASISASTTPPPPNPLASAPTLDITGPVACAFDTPAIKSPLPLFTLKSKREFAEVLSGPLRLVVPYTGDPIAEIARPGIMLHAITHTSLHAAAPVVLGGVLSVAAETEIGWTSGTAGMLNPTVGLKIFEPDRPFEAHPCKDFALDATKFDHKQLLPKSGTKQRTRLITDKRPVKLATSANDPFLGALDSHFALARVTELTKESGRSLITIVLKEGTLFGWVATADLDPDEKIVGIGAGVGGPGAKPMQQISAAHLYSVVCSHDVRIIAEQREDDAVQYTFVGSIHAGSKFIYQSQGDLVVPLLGVAGVAPLWGRLVVEVDAMKDCTRTPAD